MNTNFTVSKVKAATRSHAYDSEQKTRFELVNKSSEFGVYDSIIAAKRALVSSFSPELINASNEHITRCCKEHISGTNRCYKITKTTQPIDVKFKIATNF